MNTGTTFNSTQTVGEIVALFPKASELFKKYRIDFCCGGNRQLSDALKEQKLDESLILGKLDELYGKNSGVKNAEKNFFKMSSWELIEHIENTHHAYLKKVLPELSDLTAMIMRVHGLNHEELFSVYKLFLTLRTELEAHMVKEELIHFTLIELNESNLDNQNFDRIMQVMKETEDEHDAAGSILKELRKITEDYKVPDDGCNTYLNTYRMLEELESDLYQHIHLENNILFKRLKEEQEEASE